MASNSKKNLPAPIKPSLKGKVQQALIHPPEEHPELLQPWLNAVEGLAPAHIYQDADGRLQLHQNSVMDMTVELHQATGCALFNPASYLLNQTGNVVSGLGVSHLDATNIAAHLMAEMRPGNAVEGMLCSQMIAVHNASMNAAVNAAHPKSTEQADKSLKTMEKLSGLFVRQAEALAKLRGGGKQEVQVTHVHQNVQVNEGGQALVAGTGG